MTADGQGEAVLGLCFLTMGENQQDRRHRPAEEARRDSPDAAAGRGGDGCLRPHRAGGRGDRARCARNLFEGGLLVIAVLFAFLGNLRAAFIVALGDSRSRCSSPSAACGGSALPPASCRSERSTSGWWSIPAW